MDRFFEDERGTIKDLLENVDSVTEIFTRKDAVRGNHVHNITTQWTYIVSGSLHAVHADGWEKTCGPGELIVEKRGVAHAWKALEDTWVLVFRKGGNGDYENDTVRLSERLIS